MITAVVVCLSVATALPTQAADVPLERSLLLVREGDEWSPLMEIAPDVAIVDLPVPLLARSPRVVRATRSPQGIGFAVVCGRSGALAIGAIGLATVVHPSDAQVLLVNGTAQLVGPARLPYSVVRPQDEAELLPEVTRLDLDAIEGGELRVLPPAGGSAGSLLCIAHEQSGDALVWIGDAKKSTALPCGPRAALALDVGTAEPVALALGSAQLDQLFFAALEPLSAERRRELALRSTRSVRPTFGAARARHGEGRRWPAIEVSTARPSADDLDAAAGAHGPGHGLLQPGEMREFWFEAPGATPEGSTATLLVSLSAHTETDGASAPRSAVDAPRTSGLFRDRTRAAGLRFVHMEGPDEQLDIRPTMGPGLALGDIDGDGWVDVFFVQGGGRAGSRTPASRMYRNRGDGTFDDVTRACGLEVESHGMGALFVDVDGDRDLDLFVASYGPNALYVNDGRGRFTRSAAALGTSNDAWHAGIAAADYDRDGDIDLYVSSYLRYDESQMPAEEELGRYRREDPIAMLPFAFAGARKHLLRNDTAIEADGEVTLRFTEVAQELRLDDEQGRGLQPLFWDFDRDGDQDLYLANDVSPNRLWRNEGDGTFKDIGFMTGLDDPRGSMGLCAADVDADGDEDMLVTNWELESNALYQNNLVSHDSAKHRVATFRDVAVRAGLAQLSVGVTKWGCELFDADLDGDLDLFYANGYTSPDYESTGICVGQPCHYFENDGTGRFRPAFERAGEAVALPLASRALGACDFDRDGDVDLFVTANNGRARLLENTLARGEAWLGVRLAASGRNPYGIGSEVTLRAGELSWRRSLRGGTSYLTGNPPELHFGLGDVAKIDECVVRWPSGRESRHAIEELRTFVTLTEPTSASSAR